MADVIALRPRAEDPCRPEALPIRLRADHLLDLGIAAAAPRAMPHLIRHGARPR